MPVIRPATLDDASAIVALNTQFVEVTSPMDEHRFHYLLDLCCHCSVVEIERKVAGFVIAMCKGAEYENGNFQWFSDRLNKFIYVDRVVVSNMGRGQGLGSALYAHLATWAMDHDLLVMAAEMDLNPPNAGSLDFHKKRGFVELGSRELESGKTVSMQIYGVEVFKHCGDCIES